jgi:hypothetical protein
MFTGLYVLPLLQIVVVSALIVFSTYTGHGNVTIHSLNTTPSVYSFEVDYWFTADEYKFTPDNGGIIGTDEYQGHAEFYSGVGVLAFLYVLGLSACYVFLEPRLVQRKLRQYFVMDFFLTLTVAILWFISSSVWIQGAIGVKDTVDDVYERFQQYLNCSTSVKCTNDKPTYGKLWATVAFGFLNAFLWTSNGWFTFKETPWFRDRK